jgi:hypothetical protein
MRLAKQRPAPSVSMTIIDQALHELPKTGTPAGAGSPLLRGCARRGTGHRTGSILFNPMVPARDFGHAMSDWKKLVASVPAKISCDWDAIGALGAACC